MYEGNATGKIPDKHFKRMLAEYDKEQSSLEQEFSALQQAISTQKQDYENPQRFNSLVKRHTDFTELTTPVLNEFIEKVIVHEATGDRAHRKQKAALQAENTYRQVWANKENLFTGTPPCPVWPLAFIR